MSSKEYISENDKDDYFNFKRLLYRNFVQISSIILVIILLIIGRNTLPPEIILGGLILSASYLIIIISIELSKRRFRRSIKRKERQSK
jgi:hypothetical protein